MKLNKYSQSRDGNVVIGSFETQKGSSSESTTAPSESPSVDRSVWGQQDDGVSDIDGDMVVVGDISANNISISGDFSGRNARYTGNVSVSGSITADGTVFAGALQVEGKSSFNDDVTIDGNISAYEALFLPSEKSGFHVTPFEGVKRLVPRGTYQNEPNQSNDTFANQGKWIGVADRLVRSVAMSLTNTVQYLSLRDEVVVVSSLGLYGILCVPNPSECPGKVYIIKNLSGSDELYAGHEPLGVAQVSGGGFIRPDSNSPYNDSAGNYKNLMKCGRSVHMIISDGSSWIDCLLA